MAIQATANMTLSSIVDVISVGIYYKLDDNEPNRPKTLEDLTTNGWSIEEPSYTEGSLATLYTVSLTTFSDSSFTFSEVNTSSSYEAAKAAWLKVNNLKVGGRNFIENSKKLIIENTMFTSPHDDSFHRFIEYNIGDIVNEILENTPINISFNIYVDPQNKPIGDIKDFQLNCMSSEDIYGGKIHINPISIPINKKNILGERVSYNTTLTYSSNLDTENNEYVYYEVDESDRIIYTLTNETLSDEQLLEKPEQDQKKSDVLNQTNVNATTLDGDQVYYYTDSNNIEIYYILEDNATSGKEYYLVQRIDKLYQVSEKNTSGILNGSKVDNASTNINTPVYKYTIGGETKYYTIINEYVNDEVVKTYYDVLYTTPKIYTVSTRKMRNRKDTIINSKELVKNKLTVDGKEFYKITSTSIVSGSTSTVTKYYVPVATNILNFKTSEQNGNYFYIENLQLEIGNIATDWKPAPEDALDSIYDMQERFDTIVDENTKINQFANKILLQATSVYESIDGKIKSEVSSQTEQTAESFNVEFSKINNQIGDITKKTDYIKLSGDGIEIGEFGDSPDVQSTLKSKFSNTDLSFLYGEKPLASFTNEGLAAPEVSVGNQLTFGEKIDNADSTKYTTDDDWSIRQGKKQTKGINLDIIWIGG